MKELSLEEKLEARELVALLVCYYTDDLMSERQFLDAGEGYGLFHRVDRERERGD